MIAHCHMSRYNDGVHGKKIHKNCIRHKCCILSPQVACLAPESLCFQQGPRHLQPTASSSWSSRWKITNNIWRTWFVCCLFLTSLVMDVYVALELKGFPITSFWKQGRLIKCHFFCAMYRIIPWRNTQYQYVIWRSLLRVCKGQVQKPV